MQGAGGKDVAIGVGTVTGGAGGGIAGAVGCDDCANAMPHPSSAMARVSFVPNEAAAPPACLSATRKLITMRDRLGIRAGAQFIKIQSLALAFGSDALGHETVQ